MAGAQGELCVRPAGGVGGVVEGDDGGVLEAGTFAETCGLGGGRWLREAGEEEEEEDVEEGGGCDGLHCGCWLGSMVGDGFLLGGSGGWLGRKGGPVVG